MKTLTKKAIFIGCFISVFIISSISINISTFRFFNNTTQLSDRGTQQFENIQTSTSPLSKDHQILPISILVYTQYADTEGEVNHTMLAIDNTYGTDYYYENLTDYTELNAKLPGHDVLLIPEQEESPDDASHTLMKSIGATWATTLNNFVLNGGIVILLDYATFHYYGPGLHIYNESGLMTINGVLDDTGWTGTLSTLNLVDTSDALARGIASSWGAASGTISIDTDESTVVVEDNNNNPIVVHKVMGKGHIVYMGFDLYGSDANYENLLGNAIRLHRHVIFDESHNPDNHICNEFSSLTDDLVSQGFAVSNMSIFNPLTFAACDVLVITGRGTLYTIGEIDSIEDFVKNGGGLFIATDNLAYGDKLDSLLLRFGFNRNVVSVLNDTDDYVGTKEYWIEFDNINNHSATLGVNTAEFYACSGFITIPTMGIPLISTDTDSSSIWWTGSPAKGIPVAAAATYNGYGRTIVSADYSFMQDDIDTDSDGIINYYDDDNEKFLNNSINWLSAAGAEECVVLFDESHNPYFKIEDPKYLTFGNYLTSNGYTLKWMSTFQTKLIENVDILFICDGTTNYNSFEINNISQFVSAGGSLFLLGDNIQYSQQINPIANVFSIYFNTTAGWLIDTDDYFFNTGCIVYEETNFATHSITEEISRIEINRGTGFLTKSSGMNLITTDTDGTSFWYNNTQTAPANGISIMMANQYLAGRVIVFTDVNFMDSQSDVDNDGDGNFFDSDNERLTVNSFQWLSERSIPLSGGNGDDDDGGDGIIEFPWSRLIIIIIILCAILGIITLVAIAVILKKRR